LIDALLYAIRDNLLDPANGLNLKLSQAVCKIMEDGHPAPYAGDLFVAIHQGDERSTNDNVLNEYYSFIVTMTMRVTIPLDRVGEKMLAIKLARSSGFNARASRIKNFLHMAWGILQDANENLLNFNPDNTGIVYGFCEPARYRGKIKPVLVGGEWFSATPEADDVGLKADLRFEDCRRFQPIGAYVG
jgi:hypothetical protein